MVIGEGFAWSHLPKTGGDATARMFEVVGHLVLASDPPSSHEKHESFTSREAHTGLDLTEARRRIVNIRRLPAWLLSSARHQERHYAVPVDWEQLRRGLVRSRTPFGRLHPFLRPRLVATAAYRALGRTETVSADTVLERHRCGRVDHWLRQEHLADDFLAVVGRFGDISAAQAEQIRGVGSVNASGYDHDVHNHFDGGALASLYEHNPGWAEVERVVYGGTLSDA